MVSVGQAMVMRIIAEHPGEAYGRGIAKMWNSLIVPKRVTCAHVYQTIMRLRSRDLVEPTGEYKVGPRGAPVKLLRLTEKGKVTMEMVDKIYELTSQATDGRTVIKWEVEE
jgi:DNA-binding PadR family transcriptional regulator